MKIYFAKVMTVMSGNSVARMVNLKDLILAALAIAGIIPASNLCHAQTVRTAQIADFDELFVVEDTTRLDQSAHRQD